MEINEALNNVRLAVEAFKGTKQEHIFLEQSMNLIIEKVTPSVSPDKENPVAEDSDAKK